MIRLARRWRLTCFAAVALASLAMVAGVVGLSAGTAAARTFGAAFGASFSAPTPHWTPVVKGTVAASPAPSSTGFTLDVPGCSTPQSISTSSTTYSYLPSTGTTPTGVQAGDRVLVALEPNTSTLTARSVTILLASITGTVDTLSPLVVTDPQGFLRTINVSGTTTYVPAGSTVGLGDLITAFGTVDPDHVSLDALVIHVRTTSPSTPPAAPNHGVITGVVAASPVPTSSGFTLDENDGTTQALSTNSSTKYFEPGALSAPSGVVPGDHVAVVLVPAASVPTAAVVFIALDQLDGTVVSTSTSSFVISDHQGFWRTIDVSDTQYSPPGTSLNTLTAGEHVVAFGNVDPDGTDLDAQFVHVLPTPAVNSWYLSVWASAPSSCPVVPPSFPANPADSSWPQPQNAQSGNNAAAHAYDPGSGGGFGAHNSGSSGSSFVGHTNGNAAGNPSGPNSSSSGSSDWSGGSSGGSGGPGRGSGDPGGSSSYGGSSGRGGGPGGGQGSGGGFGGGFGGGRG